MIIEEYFLFTFNEITNVSNLFKQAIPFPLVFFLGLEKTASLPSNYTSHCTAYGILVEELSTASPR